MFITDLQHLSSTSYNYFVTYWTTTQPSHDKKSFHHSLNKGIKKIKHIKMIEVNEMFCVKDKYMKLKPSTDLVICWQYFTG